MEYYHENSYILKGCENIRKYITGGHGVVTLESPSGKYYTYCFKKPKSPDKFPLGTLFAYVLEGKNACNYIGVLDIRRGFRKTCNSEYDEYCEQFKGARYIIQMATKDFDTPMKLYHEGVCSCCGKKLTKPESIQAGIGPKCAKLLGVTL